MVWVGADEAPAPGLAIATSAGAVALGPWETFPGAGPTRLWFQRVALTGLEPRGAYRAELRRDAEALADATVRTLPARVPLPGERPFTVLLASCFCALRDREDRLNATYRQLPERPDVKVLCGDQVYLDEPWSAYAFRVFDGKALLERHFDNYWSVWAQPGGAAGCRGFLTDGPNYFVADDHEFWNNAPNFGIYIQNSWTDAGRDEWFGLARELYQAFQTPGTRATFEVGALSFLTLDTRLHRAADRSRLVADDDLAALERWVERLAGPGVLVVGQPVLAEQSGFFGRFVDWGLADYDQYPALAGALARAQHSVVVLTGDVHFGRFAACALVPGTELIEIISSPTALAEKTFGGDWYAAPGRFPAFAIPGVAQRRVATDPGFTMVDDHFLTLEFLSAGADVRMTVKAWPVVNPPAAPIEVATRLLR